MRAHPLEEVTCRGSHFDMGCQQGEWVRPRIPEIFSPLLDNGFTPRWLRYVNLNLIGSVVSLKGVMIEKRHVPNIIKVARPQMKRMSGIASGSGLSLNLLLGITSIEMMAARMDFVMGCTSLAIGRERSRTGKPLLGYNHDFPLFLRDQIFVRRSVPNKGFSSVQLTYPPLPGCICGVNEAGLAITLNHAFTTENRNHGVPPTIMVQQALDSCRTAEEVVKLLRKAKYSCGSLVTIIDKSGDMYVCELGRERFGVRKSSDGLCLTLNDYQIAELRAVEVPSDAKFHPRKFPSYFHGHYIHRSNWERRERFETVLDRKRKLTRKDLVGYLGDHNGSGNGDLGTICRHHETADTIATAIIHPQDRMLEVARGYACKARYQTYSL